MQLLEMAAVPSSSTSMQGVARRMEEGARVQLILVARHRLNEGWRRWCPGGAVQWELTLVGVVYAFMVKGRWKVEMVQGWHVSSQCPVAVPEE